MTTMAWLVVAGGIIAVVFFLWQKSRQRLGMRIESIPPERIDPTPTERNEIIGSVRVRERVTPSVSAPSPALTAENNAPATTQDGNPAVRADREDLAEPVMPTASAEAIEATVAPPQTTPSLVQEDLFPDAPISEPKTAAQSDRFNSVITIHIMPRHQALLGDALLTKLIHYGFRFGDMDIFHRHEHPSGQGSVLFSLAQSQEPGTFDLDALKQTTVPGITLFLGLPHPKAGLALELMLATGRRLCQDFDGDMLDEQGHILTSERIADWYELLKKGL